MEDQVRNSEAVCKRWFVEIEKVNSQYQGRIHKGDPSVALFLPNLELSPESEIKIKGELYQLGALVQALIQFNREDLEIAFDERGQLSIGQHLYSELFNKSNYAELQYTENEPNIEVRIVAKDEFIARLPWAVMANKGIFLSAIGWSVAISTKIDLIDCELPPSPRILVVAPEPIGVEQTNAEAHIENIIKRLSEIDKRLSLNTNVKVADTWEEYVRLANVFDPHVVYYYGHGEGDSYSSRLVFATGKDSKRRDIPGADFALVLRKMKIPPLIVYVNCCLGDAGGVLGVGMQLENFIPAVITNRTKTFIDVAQSQAMAVWESILIDGIEPHKAISEVYSRLIEIDLTLADSRWITPVIYCHYDSWRTNLPRKAVPTQQLSDPHWHLRIDRVSQFSTIATLTRQMLRDRKPRSLIFVWYGEDGQGLEHFHDRLNVELQVDLSSTVIYPVLPDWPSELYNLDRSFRDVLTEAFEVNYLEDIPARIRSETYGHSGVQTLVYVRHQPVNSPRLINPRTLREYFLWWDCEFAPLLKDTQFYLLLGISIVVKNPPKFRKLTLEDERLDEVDLENTVFRLLDEMEKVARRDLLIFLRANDIRLPPNRRDQMIDRILEKTGGKYEKTVEELRNLVEQAWDTTENEVEIIRKSIQDYDY